MVRIAKFRTFRLYLHDNKLVKLKDVEVYEAKGSVYLVGNPITLKLERIKGLGLVVFDANGIIGHTQKLPKFLREVIKPNPEYGAYRR